MKAEKIMLLLRWPHLAESIM